MDSVNNNQFEVKPITAKRKITSCNVYLNPALDILANEDPICNTAMEIPVKKRKRTKSTDIVTFENSALDLGAKPVNEILVREIDNVRKTVTLDFTEEIKTKVCKETFFGDTDDVDFTNTIDSSNFNDNEVNNAAKDFTEPIYANLDVKPESVTSETPVLPKQETTACNSIVETTAIESNTKDSLLNCTDISRIDKDNTETDSGILVEQKSVNKDLSNITNIHTNVTNQVILNNSNINLSFIDRLALDSPNISDRSLYYDDDLNESNIMEIKTITIITKKKRFVEKKNTNPFLNPNIETVVIPKNNPFLDMKPEIEYQEEVLNRQEETATGYNNALMPRRLFDSTNSTISTVNESIDHPEYENIDIHQDPIYENIDELNKQSKLLGYDVSQFSSLDILNLKKANSSNDSNDSKKEKHSFFKPGKLSKKVFKTLKKTFKHDKAETDVTLNPYEVPRKLPKQKAVAKDTGIENPALNLDNSDDLEIEELSDEEHQYETIKTLRNTRLNMNVTPLRERNEDTDTSKTTPSKKVRFDSTLNQEKVITGNSFDCSVASPGFDAKIDKYHDELENCINERKFLQQNM